MADHNFGRNISATVLQGLTDYCEPKVYGLDEEGNPDPLAVVSGFEACMLLLCYASYVAICAYWAQVMDRFCPAYARAADIGFADMGRVSTSYEDETNGAGKEQDSRASIAAYKKKRAKELAETNSARHMVGLMLHGEDSLEATTDDPSNASDPDLKGVDPRLSEALTSDDGSVRPFPHLSLAAVFQSEAALCFRS
jgi:hypothetical protein